MPRRKEFLKPRENSSRKGKSKAPVTANEYLAAGVNFEEAGEKWRAGDAAKSLRFFSRAIEIYDEGLHQFTDSFDLAYNKARLQYEVAQQPRLLAHLPTASIDLLQLALESHRVALKIDPNSPNLLFNTGQLLTSLAEVAAVNRSNRTSVNHDEALNNLQEALELLQRCLHIQEKEYYKSENGSLEDADTHLKQCEPETNTDVSTMSGASQEEQWASIEEPITLDILLDSVLAQLDTLTAINNLGPLADQKDILWMEEYYRDTLQPKVATYVASSGRQHEVALAEAKFVAALSDAAFQYGKLDIVTYGRELGNAFSDKDLDLESDPVGLFDKADAYLTFSTSIQSSIVHLQQVEVQQLAALCWKYITKALDSLTAASNIIGAQNLARIHLRRGDCELMRLRLGEQPMSWDLTIRSAPTLLTNAEIYFRGAAKIAKSEDAAEEQMEAEVKEAIVAALNGSSQKLSSLAGHQRKAKQKIADDMRDEGLIAEGDLRNLFEG